MDPAGRLVAGFVKLDRQIQGISTTFQFLQMLQPHFGVFSVDWPHLEEDDCRHPEGYHILHGMRAFDFLMRLISYTNLRLPDRNA